MFLQKAYPVGHGASLDPRSIFSSVNRLVDRPRVSLGFNRPRKLGLLLTITISFPAALLNAFVHLSFLGFLFILKFLWHLLLQNLNILASLRTKEMPWPGYTREEQK